MVALIVTVCPAWITTESPQLGAEPQDHVEPVAQLPFPVDLHNAEWRSPAAKTVRNETKRYISRLRTALVINLMKKPYFSLVIIVLRYGSGWVSFLIQSYSHPPHFYVF
jgi:hypothetical protein